MLGMHDVVRMTGLSNVDGCDNRRPTGGKLW
jgi:hypothetical protein